MTEEKHVWSEEDLEENRMTYNYLLGQCMGWEQASGWLMEKAGEYFKKSRDKEAGMLRELATLADQKSKVRRAEADKHEREYCQNEEEDA